MQQFAVEFCNLSTTAHRGSVVPKVGETSGEGKFLPLGCFVVLRRTEWRWVANSGSISTGFTF